MRKLTISYSQLTVCYIYLMLLLYKRAETLHCFRDLKDKGYEPMTKDISSTGDHTCS